VPRDFRPLGFLHKSNLNDRELLRAMPRQGIEYCEDISEIEQMVLIYCTITKSLIKSSEKLCFSFALRMWSGNILNFYIKLIYMAYSNLILCSCEKRKYFVT
jgi:hypothetical protein